MNAVSDYSKFVQKARLAMMGIANSSTFDPDDWRSEQHRFGNVLQMIREGRTDAEISARWPGVIGDVLHVYHLIAEGRTCEIRQEYDEKEAKKTAKRKEREFMESYRRRYCNAPRRDL